MEQFKSFDELAVEQGGIIRPCVLSEELINEYESYMIESIRQSRMMHEEAVRTARDIWIN